MRVGQRAAAWLDHRTQANRQRSALARWAQVGFRRVATGRAGAGWWEPLRRG